MTQTYHNSENDGKHIILKPYSKYNNTHNYIFIRNGTTHIDVYKVVNESVEKLTTTEPESKSKYPKHWKKFKDDKDVESSKC